MQKIDLKKIIEDIHSEISVKGFKQSSVKFADIPILSTEGMKNSFDLKVNENNDGGGIKSIIKKFIRKLTRGAYTKTINNQQKFNICTFETVKELAFIVEKQQHKIMELEKQIFRNK